MRKDWIRTEEERELRRLKNQCKQQGKNDKSTNMLALNFPIVMRKKKRLPTVTTALSELPSVTTVQTVIPRPTMVNTHP